MHEISCATLDQDGYVGHWWGLHDDMKTAGSCTNFEVLRWWSLTTDDHCSNPEL